MYMRFISAVYNLNNVLTSVITKQTYMYSVCESSYKKIVKETCVTWN